MPIPQKQQVVFFCESARHTSTRPGNTNATGPLANVAGAAAKRAAVPLFDCGKICMKILNRSIPLNWVLAGQHLHDRKQAVPYVCYAGENVSL